MNCSACGSTNPNGAKFCMECGGALAARCKKCGATLPAGAKFCLECGTGVGAALPALSPRPASGHIAERIRQAKASVEGERKRVTVLFADVQSSMDLAGSMDPEEWSGIMQRFFEILAGGVERFEGYVDKFTGDGIMALFGAPIAHEDHATRACYAALHLRDELARYAVELKRKHGLVFSTRMGLNSGEVVVGRIGDDLHMEYTAQGHTVGLAQRMENLASPDTCFLSAATAKLVHGYFSLEDLGEFQIKGGGPPAHVHRLDGIGTSRTRLDVSRSRGFSRFVGRGDEMHILESALARAREGEAQIIGIVADAGLGKSRLSFEFLERCRAHGLMTYETTGVAHGRATPMVPILKLFRDFYGITDQDSAATARERIAGRLLLIDLSLRDELPLVFEQLGYPDPENPAPKMDPDKRQRQGFNILRRVVQARGQKETQVLLLEDLHWFDGGSAAYLEPLVDAVTGTKSLVIMNFRPEFHASWMGKSNYLKLPLGPLGADAIRELLDTLLGKDSSLKGLAEAIHVRTAGNPFYTEEVVQNLIETGKLQGSKGAYRLVTPVSKLEVPSSVHALLAARIDRLTEREKDVLQTAAVIGREFDEPTLAAVVEQDAPQLREALQRLKETEFVYEQSLYPITEYTFKHPLTQEVALATQLQEKRRRLHAAVASVIEAAHTSDKERQSALLAHHWEQSGDLAQAVRWHRRAAEWATTRDIVESLRHWIKVRELGHSLTNDDAKESRLRACCAILTTGVWRLGMETAEVESCVEEARQLARELEKESAVAVALGGYSTHIGMLGKIEAALDLGIEASDLLGDVHDDRHVFINTNRTYWLLMGGRLPQAIEALKAWVDWTRGDPRVGLDTTGYSVQAWAEGLLGNALVQNGQIAEGMRAVQRAIKLCREHDLQENLIWALSALSYVSLLRGGLAETPAAELQSGALEAVKVAEAVDSPQSTVLAATALGAYLYLAGQYEACEEQLINAITLARRVGTAREIESFVLANLADSCRGRGDLDGAIAWAREAVAFADTGGSWTYGATARASLIDALLQAGGSSDEIGGLIAEARTLVDKSGGKVVLPRLREAEARLDACGDVAALQAGLREAVQMYRRMDMPDPAERLERELASFA